MRKKIFIYVLGFVIIYLTYINVKVLYFNIKYSFEINRIKKEIVKEKVLQDDLKDKIKDTKKESYIEEKARTILGLVKKGEVAYQIINKKGDRD
ncbi:MAG: septum formation initiator family protein [Candidatus Margulisbacteria bacterium]|nr:septum formation initiator family protein [Candidatus Margulisiibacteriota bacterium]